MEARSPSFDHQDTLPGDEHLFGWDPTPGIVSVWAAQAGTALVWQRSGDRVTWRVD